MPAVTIDYAQANLSRLIKKAAAGEEIIIARGDTPVARLVPYGVMKGKRQSGSLKGKLHVGPELTGSLGISHAVHLELIFDAYGVRCIW